MCARLIEAGYLQLVDRGILTLDTDMTELYPPLKQAASKILLGVEDGKARFEKNVKPITLLQMLNQSSGFGMEFGDNVQAWKKVADKGTGFVNSCKKVRRLLLFARLCQENLIHTPITFSPGTSYQYGNSAEYVYPSQV